MVGRWIMLPHSRTQEYEADHIGLVLSAKAGYNPNAALSFWKKFSAQKSNRPEYMSTHPTPAHRIEKIKELIPKVMPYYEASKKQSTQKIEEKKEK
jgi:predicted Zn-dependent protease